MNTTDNRTPRPRRSAGMRPQRGGVQAPPRAPAEQPMPQQGMPVMQPMPQQGMPMHPGAPVMQPMPQQGAPVPPRAPAGRKMMRQRAQAAPGKQATRPLRQKPEKPRRKRRAREIVYTPSQPFNRKKLLLQLGIIAAVVAAMVFTMSLFFKVDTITVSGNQKYSAEAIAEASGIEVGDGLLSVSGASVGGKIITKLPYVQSVRVGIKLPGTVNIEIEELDVVYAIADEYDSWWLMTSQGRLVEAVDTAKASNYTKILGVNLSAPSVGQQASVVEVVPQTTEGEEETKPVTVTNTQRLNAAFDILEYLEANGVMGQMTSLDVSDMGSIEMMQGQRFRILLGDATDLEYKISLAIAAMNQLKDYDRGTLDVSFLDRPEVVYTPQVD